MSARCGLLVGVVLCLSLSGAAAATGIAFGLHGYTLDLGAALARVPQAVEAALTAVGIPEEEIAQAIGEMEEGLGEVPTQVPVPLLGGAIEVGLPLVVIDGVRLSGGLLNDGITRGLAGLFGVEIPQPLAEGTFGEGEGAGTYSADLAFSASLLSAEAVKRFDLVLLGFVLGLGLDVVQGQVTPLLDVDVPGHEAEVEAALAALHLDELRWSAFALHGGVGIELGPPFLRLFAEARFLVPLGGSTGFWGLRPGDLGFSLGMVIHF
jgi:hypothetical protein